MPPIGWGPLIIREYIWSGIKKTFTFWVNGIERIRVRMEWSFRWRRQWSALSRENLNGEKIQPADSEVCWTSTHSGGTRGCKGFGAIPGMVTSCLLLKPSHRLLPFLKQPLSDPCSSSPCLPNSSSSFKSQFWYIPTPEIPWTSFFFCITWLAIYLTCSESILSLTLTMLFL